VVVEKEVLPLTTWLFPSQHGYGAIAVFAIVTVLLAALMILMGYLISAVRHGPIEAFFRTCQVLFDGFGSLARVRIGRIWAMTRLAFQEAIRRWVLVAFAIFLLLLLFGSWMLTRGSDHPARLNISFLLGSTQLLVLLLAVLLSTFSLPADIRNRTIHTVVTKPVLAWEILLGRIFGFAIVGTIMLVAMAVLSYLFVIGELAHRHTIDPEKLDSIVARTGEAEQSGLEGETSLHRRLRHRHPVRLDEQGKGYTEFVKDHRHPVVATGTGEDRVYHVGPATGWMQARVPIYGDLRFLDRAGKPAARGVNVGNEWMYRSFIEGGTGATAIWRFQGISQTRFPGGKLPVDMTIRVFRTHKGDIERGIAGRIVLKNPHTNLASVPIPFTAREFTVDQKVIPRKLKSTSGKDIDLFNDLVSSGELEIHVQCEERAQYYGMADADLYLRGADGRFFVNFFKGYLSIWFQMVLVIGFGVLFSALVSGPVALLTTITALVIGYFSQFVVDIATGKMEGGGPLEAGYRMFTHENMVTPLEPGVTTAAMQGTDTVLMFFMRLITALLPDFSNIDTSRYVADGYYISATLIGQHLLMTVGYLLVITTLGYFLLKTREIAA
jgi:hypothetical protein